MDNMNNLVDAVTKEIMKRLGAADKPKILVLGKDADCPIADCLNSSFQADVKPNLQDSGSYDYVVIPVYYLNKAQAGSGCTANPESGAVAAAGETLDLIGKKLIHERELREKCSSSIACLKVGKKAIITQLALDYIKKCQINVIRVD